MFKWFLAFNYKYNKIYILSKDNYELEIKYDGFSCSYTSIFLILNYYISLCFCDGLHKNYAKHTSKQIYIPCTCKRMKAVNNACW